MQSELLLIQHLFQSIDTQQWDKLPRFFTPEVTYERPGYDPLVGLEQMLHFYRMVRVIASGTHTLEQVVSDEGRGACWGRFVGVHKDGSPLDERFADVYTFADGKIATRRSYFFRPAV
jgi:ketosteroid isomerase-like protein